MLRVYVPIRENDVERSLHVSKNTSLYLIEQAKENINFLFNDQKDAIIKLLIKEFILQLEVEVFFWVLEPLPTD